MSNDLDEAALNDAEELLKSAGEKTEDVDTPVKKENESEDSKTSIDEASSEGNPISIIFPYHQHSSLQFESYQSMTFCY